MTHSSDPLRIPRGRKPRPITLSTSNCLRFNFGNRSVPPATNIARGPRSAAIFAASRAVFGRRYLNRGSRSIEVLGRWFDLDGRWIRDRWKARGAVAPGLSFLFASQRLDHFLRRHRDLVDPHPKRVVNRGAKRRRDLGQRGPSFLLPALGALRVHV